MDEDKGEDKTSSDENLIVKVFDYLTSRLDYFSDALESITMDSNSSDITNDHNRKYPAFEVRSIKPSSKNITELAPSSGIHTTMATIKKTLVNTAVGDRDVRTVPGILDLNDTFNKTGLDQTVGWSNQMNTTTVLQSCYSSPEEYDIIPAMLCSSMLVVGVVYIIYGFRCFRAISFITSLILGTILAYLVLIVENTTITSLPYGNVIAALLIGLAIAFLSSLVMFAGLFMFGVNLGLLFGAAVLIVIYLLRPYFDVLSQPLPTVTLVIFYTALSLVGCFSTLYFSKGCTIIASSLYGSALTLMCVDYFVEHFRIVYWLFDQMSNHTEDWFGLLKALPRGETPDCLGTQIILALWPIFTLFGILIQSLITAKGVHYDGYGLITTDARRNRPAAFMDSPISCTKSRNVSSTSKHRNPEESQLEQRHKKYRYLYQVRTAHGDVISQNYLQSMNNKKLCLPEQDSFTFNSDLSSHFMPSESRTTTLSAA